MTSQIDRVGLGDSDLVTLCAGVQQALLDGELQQVVILVPHWLAAAWAEGGVVCRGLEHRGVHLTVEGSGRLTWVKMVYNITVYASKSSIILKSLSVFCFGNSYTHLTFLAYFLKPKNNSHQLLRSPLVCEPSQN